MPRAKPPAATRTYETARKNTFLISGLQAPPAYPSRIQGAPDPAPAPAAVPRVMYQEVDCHAAAPIAAACAVPVKAPSKDSCARALSCDRKNGSMGQGLVHDTIPLGEA